MTPAQTSSQVESAIAFAEYAAAAATANATTSSNVDKPVRQQILELILAVPNWDVEPAVGLQGELGARKEGGRRAPVYASGAMEIDLSLLFAAALFFDSGPGCQARKIGPCQTSWPLLWCRRHLVWRRNGSGKIARGCCSP